MSTRHVLSANLRALMADRAELDTLKKITEASGARLSNGKLDRIRRATHATDVDTLGELAEVFQLQPWQLLVPNLNPAALPQITGRELLESIKSLVLAEGTQPVRTDNSHRSGTKQSLGRLPGEVIRTGRGKGQTGAVNQPGTASTKRRRGGA